MLATLLLLVPAPGPLPSLALPQECQFSGGSSGSSPGPITPLPGPSTRGGSARPGVAFTPGDAATAGAPRPNPASSGGRAAPPPVAPSPSNAPRTGFAVLPSGPDDSSWTLWWGHNREAYFEELVWNSTIASDADATSSEARHMQLEDAEVQRRIVPALLAALEDKPSAELRRAILLSLAKIGQRAGPQLGSSKLQDLFLGHLSDSNSLVAETACVALGILDRPSALPHLASLLRDDQAGRQLVGKQSVSARMQAYAAYGIGLLGEHAEIVDVRRYASHVLTQALAGECGSTPDVHVAAVIGLGLVGQDEQATKTLLGVLANRQEHDEARAHAPAALAKLAARGSGELRHEVLLELMRHAELRTEDSVVQQGCIQALGSALRCGPGDAELREQLLQIAKKGRTQEQGWALLALARVAARPEPTAADPMQGSFEIQGKLMKGLTQAKSTVRPWAALSIGVLAHQLRAEGQSVPASLGRALRDELGRTNSPEQALALGIGLGLSRYPGGELALQEKLKRFDVETRSMLGTALGLHGDRGSSETLVSELHEARHTPGTLITSAHSLALLERADVVEELKGMLEECDCLLSSAGITFALASTRHPLAVDPLLAQLNRKGATQSHRVLAAVALGNLAEKDAQPWSLRLSEGVNYRAHVSTLTEPDYGILQLP